MKPFFRYLETRHFKNYIEYIGVPLLVIRVSFVFRFKRRNLEDSKSWRPHWTL